MLPVYVLRFFVLSQMSVMLLWAMNVNGHHHDCPNSFDCGSLGTIRFPFNKAERQDCGALAIHGCDDNQQVHLIIGGRKLPVRKIGSYTVYILDEHLRELLESGSCEAFDYNITLPPTSPLGNFTISNNITMFKCKRSHNETPQTFFKNTSCGYNIFFDSPDSDDVPPISLAACPTVHLPTIDRHLISANPFAFLTAEVPIQFNPSVDCARCQQQFQDIVEGRGSSGRCFLDSKGNFYCAKRKDTSSARRIVLAWLLLCDSLCGRSHKRRDECNGNPFANHFQIPQPLKFQAAAAVALLLLLACCLRRKLFSLTIRCFWNKDFPTDEVIIERFLNEHGPLRTRRYSYSDIEKATNCFKVKLGQGGYGSVYKGKLQDGRLVAVKVLSELKRTGEEFMNEVASIIRTSHVNIVTLVGFCFQGFKRALIYEYMPNGSLEKFIHEEDSRKVGQQLNCKTLYDIAIGVAHGLDYLHRGCNTRILHFDIKPHNILLDEDFCPKISDFGLAKICPRKESIVSIMCARGTIGYIAPEVFSKNFGGVSHKADVYSYGMMVLEMVGGRHNKNVQVDCSSELYFPHWIYKQLELNQHFGLQCIKNESDRETVKKMTMVSLWCIQIDPSSRPSMSKVVEMLEGSLESLELPPKPFLHSSPTSPAHYSTQTFETL